MKSLLIVAVSVFALSGCAALCPKPEVITKIERDVVKVPDEHLIIPDYVNSINYETATEKDVAQWIISSEDRMKRLETQLREIRKFNETVK